MGAIEAALFCLFEFWGPGPRTWRCRLPSLCFAAAATPLRIGVAGENGERGRRDEGYLRWFEALQGMVRTNAICLDVLIGRLGKVAQGRRLFLNH